MGPDIIDKMRNFNFMFIKGGVTKIVSKKEARSEISKGYKWGSDELSLFPIGLQWGKLDGTLSVM